MTHCDGFLVIDKPAGVTSRRVVDRALRWFGRGTKMGHAGTLDPSATGVLVLCVGQATRLTEYVQQLEKVYRAEIRLGAVSDTDDADGKITPVEVASPPDRAKVETALSEFVGVIKQVPPVYSANKIQGRRAYELARKGKEVELSPKSVVVHEIRILDYDYPRLDVEVRCGSGTYIRSLARDLGQRLGCGGLIQELRRTRIGSVFTEKEAVAMDIDKNEARRRLLPLESGARAFGCVLSMDESKIAALARGKALPLNTEREDGVCCVFSPEQKLVAIVEFDRETKTVRPVKVFQPRPATSERET
ncbi:MAG: tRNA pseudouridine(55) synthase TruB [Gemmataceae bacterium]|nr:tRNA pseudouridine(55) synthase TruB [Gemmataceae bacterium]